VRFGSNAAQSSVLVRGVPDLAFIYRFENGRILRDDPLTGQADQVQLGVPVAVGNVTVTAFGLTEAPEPLPEPAPKPDQPKPSPAAPGPSYVLALIGKSDIALNSALNPPTVSIPGVEVMIGASAAEIVRHPTNPEMLGLKNLTAKSWSATTPNNAALTVDPGKTLRLERGTKIDFGIIQGEIR